MAEVIRMPRMSDTMEEGVIVGWLKKVGDKVEPGDVLAEVETDKATMELESYQEGTLLYIGIQEGPVPVNGLLAVIGEEGEDYQSLLTESTGGNGVGNDNIVATNIESAEMPLEAQKETPKAVLAPPIEVGDQRIKASPLARRMASEAGISLAQLNGSGDQGRIVKRDVEAFLAQPGSPAAAPAYHSVGDDEYEDTPLSQMRKVIARRLGESKFSAPHFYLTVEIDMAQTIVSRKQINEVAPSKISFNDIIVKACAMALRQHPAINSSWLGDKIRRNGSIHIGVAVAVDEGLLVPVIRHVDRKSLSEINAEVRDLAEKAKSRKLQPEQMQGNTFTVSNLGMLGIEEFTAIINPPDACILAVGTIVEKPVVKEGVLAIGHTMKVTMSCDHRVVDGATGARFLQSLKAILEAPIRLLV